MIDKILFQVNPDTKYPINPPVFSAYYGFCWEFGTLATPFTWDDLRDGNVKLSTDTIVLGGILPVRTVVQRLTGEAPPLIDYPDCLTNYLGRKIRRGTLAEVRDAIPDEGKLEIPIFVKPAEDQKLFTGTVCSQFMDLIRIPYPSETPVWISEPVEFLVEWRVFVLRGKPVWISQYKLSNRVGCGSLSPEANNRIHEMVKEYAANGAPAAYTIDVGIVKGRGTDVFLIEVNDGFAFGSYGLPTKLHCQMLEARWEEMMLQAKTNL